MSQKSPQSTRPACEPSLYRGRTGFIPAADHTPMAGQARDGQRRPATNASALALIGAVSHEMRNPLNGILGMAHLLAETSLDGAQRSYLDGIATSGEVLLTLVNDLLDLTALQSGAVALAFGPTDVGQLINQVLELAAPRAHAKGLALGSSLDPALGGRLAADDTLGEPPMLELDGARIRQVLTNLVSNAIKFTDAGGVRLSVELYLAGDAPALVFDVRDTGHGISPKDHDHVFAPFGRTGSAVVAGTEGTGLGLPLSRGLAQAMGGTLELVHSALGQGTHMRLTVPLGDEAIPLPTVPGTLADAHVLLALSPTLAQSPEADALCDTLRGFGALPQIFCHTEGLNQAIADADHLLIDSQFDQALLWSRLCLPPGGLRPVLLLRPDNRRLLPQLREAGFSGYLIRPVRQSSLVAMLTHRFGGEESVSFMPDPADGAPQETESPKTVLLADDNPVNALLAQTALERAGHSVQVVQDGARAIALVADGRMRGTPFDVVLLDLSMPVLDGFAAARQLRAGGYAGRLIAFSGNTDPALSAKLKAAGFDAFAQKPMAPTSLVALIDRA